MCGVDLQYAWRRCNFRSAQITRCTSTYGVDAGISGTTESLGELQMSVIPRCHIMARVVVVEELKFEMEASPKPLG